MRPEPADYNNESLSVDWDIRTEGDRRAVFCTTCNETFYSWLLKDSFKETQYEEFANERLYHSRKETHTYNQLLQKLSG